MRSTDIVAKDPGASSRLPCELGANLCSGSRDVSYTNKKTQTDGAKNRTFRSSLGLVSIMEDVNWQ